MLPWKFFGLTPRDMSGELIRTWNKVQQVGVLAGAQPSFSWIVPADRAAVVTGFSCQLVTGGDQPEGVEMFLDVPGTIVQLLYLNAPMLRMVTTSSTHGLATAACYFIAGPGQRITLTARTQLNASVQDALFGLAAFLIPRGDATYL